MNISGLLLVESNAKRILIAQMEQNVELASTQVMQICFKKHAEPFWDFGLQIKFVELSQIMAHLSIATRDYQTHKVDSQIGIYLHVLEWAHAISKEQTLPAADVLTGKRMAFKFLLLLTLRNATTKTQVGLQSLSHLSFGLKKLALQLTPTLMMI